MSAHLHVVSKNGKQFFDDTVFAVERAKCKTLSGPAKKRCCRLSASTFWVSVKLKLLKKIRA